MSVLLALLLLVFLLISAAAVLAVLVALRRGPAGTYLALAVLLLALAVGVWLTGLHSPPALP